MNGLDLSAAQTILSRALEKARQLNLKPIAIVVLDARGATKCSASEDGTSLSRMDVARGKANGALALGLGSRSLFKRAKEQPFFLSAVGPLVGGLVPVPGGVLIRNASDTVCGVVGISGDTSDNDEAIAIAGIAAAGFVADPGSES